MEHVTRLGDDMLMLADQLDVMVVARRGGTRGRVLHVDLRRSGIGRSGGLAVLAMIDESVYRHAGKEAFQSADMIAVIMGGDQIIDLLDPQRPRRRLDA